MSHASADDLRELLRALAASLSLDIEEQLAALEQRLVDRIAVAVVDELDRREWTVAAPRSRMTSPRRIASGERPAAPAASPSDPHRTVAALGPEPARLDPAGQGRGPSSRRSR